jgi:hypothetical protein
MPLADLQNPYLAPGSRLDFSLYQRPFIESNAHTTFFAGGWRSGKTTAALGFIAVSAFVDAPGCTGIVVMPTDKMVGEFLSSFFRPAFAHLIASEEKGAGVVHLLNGSRVVFLSGFQPKRIEMYTSAWAYADEIGIMEDGRGVMTKLSGRCSDGRAKRRRLGFTGVPYYGWLKTEFDGRNDSKRLMLSAKTSDNKHLPPAYLDEVKENIPAGLVDAYLNGRFVPPGSQIWPEFGERHLVDWPCEPDKRKEVIAVIDWSPRHPKVIFCERVQPGVRVGEYMMTKLALVVIDEIEPDGYDPNPPVSVEDLGQRIQHRGHTLARIIADVAGNAVEQTSAQSAVQQMVAILGQNIDFVPPHLRGIQGGIACVRLALSPMVGHPRFFVSRHLAEKTHPRGIVNGIRAYTYDKDRAGNLSDKPRSDNMSEDPADVTRYAVVCELPSEELMARHYSGQQVHASIRR